MKKALVIVLLVMGSLAIHAQNAVNFEFSGGIDDNPYLKATMERQISNLLTAINKAEYYNTSIDYSGVYIDDLAMQSINSMWENVHMKTYGGYISEPCLSVRCGSLLGYQVRNIDVRMVPIKEDYDENPNREICIDFDSNGKILDFNLALDDSQCMMILEGSKRLNDLDKRLQILHWTEWFLNAFYQKDIDFFEQVFSEDALIITGKVVRRVSYSNDKLKVQYVVMDKKFMESLRRVFKRNAYVNVKFDEIEIVQHGVNHNLYGVTLGISWHSGMYSDAGWLFAIWDFTDECNPKILLRTWQNKMDYTREQLFILDDFEGLTDED